MKRPEPLEMYQPMSLREASSLLKDKGPGGRFLAGGTDLVIAIKEKGLIPKYVVDLKKIPGLLGIRENPDGSIAIGALTTMREVETSPLITGKYPFLAQSAAEVGSIQIRNRATIGGNMANATPSADVAPSLIALDATAKLVNATGARTVPLEDFFRGPGQTVMNSDEILTEITIPKTGPRLVGDYIKFSPRDMMDLAYVGIAVVYALDEREKRCAGVRIVLGAVAPTPIRARNAEAILEGQTLTEALAAKAGDEAAKESKPISDVRSSA
ncbi:MAG TPA: xanthine dehydrogenase family protein subunit M, partial [Candidatus Binatia bacterium]